MLSCGRSPRETSSTQEPNWKIKERPFWLKFATGEMHLIHNTLVAMVQNRMPQLTPINASSWPHDLTQKVTALHIKLSEFRFVQFALPCCKRDHRSHLSLSLSPVRVNDYGPVKDTG